MSKRGSNCKVRCSSISWGSSIWKNRGSSNSR